jgi:magnesium transporter
MSKPSKSVKRALRKSHSKKIGLPPGSLVYVGNALASPPVLSLTEYDSNGLIETRLADISAWQTHSAQHATQWLNLHGVNDPALVQALGSRYGLHPLLLEDILHTDQRPKVESFDDHLFVVLRSVEYDAADMALETEQISLVLLQDTLLSFQERATGTFEPVRARLRNARGQIRRLGADYLAYALLDAVVDRYFLALEQLNEQTEALEERLLDKPDQSCLETLHKLRRATHALRRAVGPVRDMLNTLTRNEDGLFQTETIVYLRDVYDHTVHIVESIESLRDLQAGMLDIYLSSLSNRFNVELRALTVITTLFMPAALVAGIFGMNFKHMPWLDLPHGFGLAMGLMGAIAFAMVAIFWRRNWLR